MALLEAKIETSGYDGPPVLRDVAFAIDEGELVAILGANGAGKTTLLRTLSGVMVRTRGDIIFQGESIIKVPARRRVAMGIVQVLEGRRLFGDLTVLDNLRMGAITYFREKAEIRQRIEQVHELFPVLAERSDQRAATLSGGEQQMLALGRGLMSRPKVLMVDEASFGLAPLVIDDVFETLKQIRDMGTAVILVEQNARASLAIADRGIIIEHGEIVLSGPASELINDPAVVAAYLGGSSKVEPASTS